MISKLFFVAVLLLPIMASKSALASSLNCSPIKVQSQYKELEEVIHPEIIGNLYAKAMLKIATLVVEENYDSFEEIAKSILQKKETKSLNGLRNRARNYNYWKKKFRINNADFALVASLLDGSSEIKLTNEELGALNLVYIANQNASHLAFSDIIFQLISKEDNSVLVTTPQLQLALSNYPTKCIEKNFAKNQVVNILNRMSMAIADNLGDVSHEGNNIFLDQKLLVKLPFLKIAKKKYDPTNLEELHVGQRLLSEVGGSFNSYRKSNAVIHGVSNLETIKHFHKFYGLSDFAVLNKQDKTLTLFDDAARTLRKISVDISSLDDRINMGGAGIYDSVFKEGSIYYAKAMSDKGMREVFKLKQGQNVKLDGPLYILPLDIDAHKFRIKNKRLAFSGYQFYRKSRNLNYSIDDATKFKLEIRHSFKSKFVKRYIDTLETEKSSLMKILKIDNDDYNILAGFAIGVLSPESDFGKNWKYLLKEFLPGAVSIAKGNGLDVSKNSRGPTQLKVIPEDIMNYYGITKVNLADPENAAVATIAISAEFLRQLRNIGVNHKLINEENIQNYLYYLYQGKRVQIKEALATPEDNLAIKKIMNVVNNLEFLEY